MGQSLVALIPLCTRSRFTGAFNHDYLHAWSYACIFFAPHFLHSVVSRGVDSKTRPFCATQYTSKWALNISWSHTRECWASHLFIPRENTWKINIFQLMGIVKVQFYIQIIPTRFICFVSTKRFPGLKIDSKFQNETRIFSRHRGVQSHTFTWMNCAYFRQYDSHSTDEGLFRH